MEVLTGEAQRQLAMQAKHRDLPIRAAWSDLPVITEDHKASKLTPDIYDWSNTIDMRFSSIRPSIGGLSFSCEMIILRNESQELYGNIYYILIFNIL